MTLKETRALFFVRATPGIEEGIVKVRGVKLQFNNLIFCISFILGKFQPKWQPFEREERGSLEKWRESWEADRI